MLLLTEAKWQPVRLSLQTGVCSSVLMFIILESVPLSGMEKSIDVLQHTVIHIIWNLHIHHNNGTKIKNLSHNYTV